MLLSIGTIKENLIFNVKGAVGKSVHPNEEGGFLSNDLLKLSRPARSVFASMPCPDISLAEFHSTGFALHHSTNFFSAWPRWLRLIFVFSVNCPNVRA